jgi:hypothetical protein
MRNLMVFGMGTCVLSALYFFLREEGEYGWLCALAAIGFSILIHIVHERESRKWFIKETDRKWATENVHDIQDFRKF